MKSLLLSLVACLAVMSVAAVPANADPVSWVELRADTVFFSFPEPGYIEITARYSILNNMDHDEEIVSGISFQLDGVEMDVQPIDVTRSLNECRVFHTIEECTGECYPFPTSPEWIGECDWHINVIPDSIPEGCYCMFTGEKRSTVAYYGQTLATFTLDPGNGIWEPMESNNSLSVVLSPIAVESSTWGGIKALFK